MNPGRRAAVHRVATTAVAMTAAILVYLHLKGRDLAVREAEANVSAVFDFARTQITEEVRDLVARLRPWKEGDPPPRAFTEIGVFKRGAGTGEGLFAGLQPINRERENDLSLQDVRVATFTPQTDFLLSEEGVVPPTGWTPRLGFQAGGSVVLHVEAQLVDPAPSDQPPVALEVSVQAGQEPPTLLAGAPVFVPPAREVSETFRFDLKDEALQRNVHALVFRTPAGAPAVRVKWSARVGTASRREVVIALRREREVPAADPAAPKARETVWVIGTVPLERFRERLRTALASRPDFDPDGSNDRVYLTNESGSVGLAVPEFDPRVRLRVQKEGQGSLSSLATQKVKVSAPPRPGDYEGFARVTVIGAAGPVPHINGGLIVERDERQVLRSYRGLQAWHVAAILFAILLVAPAVPPLWRRVREDTELPRLFAYARPYTLHIVAILVTTVLYAATQGVYTAMVDSLADDILLSDEPSAGGRLSGFCWLLAGVAAGSFLVAWVREFLSKYVEHKVITDIRCILCDKVVHLPMAFHARQHAGDLLSRINNDVAETKRSLEMLFDDVAKQPFVILVLVGAAFVINWRLALVVFFGMPIILLPISYFGRSIKRYARKRQARKADVTQAIMQMLAGIRVVKAFRMEEHESQRIRHVSHVHLREALRVARSQVLSKESLEFLQNLSGVVVLAVGGYLVLERQVTVGDLMAFVLIITKVYKSSKDLTSTYNKMQESLAGTERIFEILDTPDSMADRPAARALVRPRQTLTFEGVEFSYAADGPPVLTGIDVEVPIGTTVALVGATGAGKSTMLDLVARFHDPTRGRVAIDGVDLRDYSRTSLMANIAVVTQEPFLFNASIAENIRYGRPGATQAEIEAAARAAFVHEEILRQAEGYETVVGERGGRLSGGQRQRITIARALLKDPPILILDEATSALDSQVEKRVQDAINNLLKDRTTFVIAHRLSTIQGADIILVLDEGSIVERGTHEELLRIPGGRYRELYEIQFAAALQGGPPSDDAVAV